MVYGHAAFEDTRNDGLGEGARSGASLRDIADPPLGLAGLRQPVGSFREQGEASKVCASPPVEGANSTKTRRGVRRLTDTSALGAILGKRWVRSSCKGV